MKITQELIGKIEKLEKNNVPEEEIKEILDLKQSIAEIKQEFKGNQDYYSVTEALKQLKEEELLEKILGKLKGEKAFELKIYRLIDKGEIVAEKGSNKTGYRIHKEEFQRFIEESEMTLKDWKERARENEKYKELYVELLEKYEDLKKQKEDESLAKNATEKVEDDVPEGQMDIEEVIQEDNVETSVTDVQQEVKEEKINTLPSEETNEIDTITEVAEPKKTPEKQQKPNITYVKIKNNLEDTFWEVTFKVNKKDIHLGSVMQENGEPRKLTTLHNITKDITVEDEELILVIQEELFKKLKK